MLKITAHRDTDVVSREDLGAFAEWYVVIEFGHDKRVQSIRFASFSS